LDKQVFVVTRKLHIYPISLFFPTLNFFTFSTTLIFRNIGYRKDGTNKFCIRSQGEDNGACLEGIGQEKNLLPLSQWVGSPFIPPSKPIETNLTSRNSYRQTYRCSSPWSRIGRWILAGVLIFIGLLLLAIILCLSARRKKRARRMTTNNPSTYTAPPQTTYANQPQYGNNAGYNGNATYAPPTGAPPQNYGNQGANEGYYASTGGVNQPQGTYQPQYK
jgi:hypothetical protein